MGILLYHLCIVNSFVFRQSPLFVSHKLINVFFTVLKTNIDYVAVFPPKVDVSKLDEKAIKSQSSN